MERSTGFQAQVQAPALPRVSCVILHLRFKISTGLGFLCVCVVLVVRGPGESSREGPASARPRGLPCGENRGSQLRPLRCPKETQSANYRTLGSSFRKRSRARLFVTPPTVSPPAANAVCGQSRGVPCVLRWWPRLCRSGSQTASISRVCALRQVQFKGLWCAVSPCNR